MSNQSPITPNAGGLMSGKTARLADVFSSDDSTPLAAGVLVIGSLVVLAVLAKTFGGLTVTVK